MTYLVGIMARISGTLEGNNSELEKGQTKRKLNKKEVMRSMSLPKVHSELLGSQRGQKSCRRINWLSKKKCKANYKLGQQRDPDKIIS